MLNNYSSLLNWFRGRLREDLLIASAPDKYLFLSIAMGSTGIVTVLKWDRTLFANATAIAIAVVVLALALRAIANRGCLSSAASDAAGRTATARSRSARRTSGLHR